MKAAGSAATKKMKHETTLAFWRCDCGTVTTERPRFKPGVPWSSCCGYLTYIEDTQL